MRFYDAEIVYGWCEIRCCRSIGVIATTLDKRVLATTCDDGLADFEDASNELLVMARALEQAVFADAPSARVKVDASTVAFLRSAVGASSWRREGAFSLSVDGRREQCFALARTISLPAFRSQSQALLLIVLSHKPLAAAAAAPAASITTAAITTIDTSSRSPLGRSGERTTVTTVFSSTTLTSPTSAPSSHRNRDMQVVIDAVNEMTDQTVLVVDARGVIVGSSNSATTLLNEHCDGARRMDDVIAGGQEIWLSLSLDLRSGDERLAQHPLGDGTPCLFRIHRLEGIVVLVIEAIGDAAVTELLGARERAKLAQQQLDEEEQANSDATGKARRVRVRLRKNSNGDSKGKKKLEIFSSNGKRSIRC